MVGLREQLTEEEMLKMKERLGITERKHFQKCWEYMGSEMVVAVGSRSKRRGWTFLPLR